MASPLLGLLASQSNCVLIPARYFHFQGGAAHALSLGDENGGLLVAPLAPRYKKHHTNSGSGNQYSAVMNTTLGMVCLTAKITLNRKVI